MKRRYIAIVLAFGGFTTWTHAQAMPPGGTSQQEASKALEELLLCKPGQLFNRQKAERAFAKLGLVKQPNESYVPAKGQKVTVFDASVLRAGISDESDQAELTVRVNDRSADELARQLGIKKQRVDGPAGPEMTDRKNTSKRSSLEIRPDSPRGATIECVSH